MEDRKEKWKKICLDRLDLSGEIRDADVQREIDRCILEDSQDVYIPLREKCRIRTELFHAIRRYGLVSELLEDEEVTEVMINGPDHIFVEKGGRISRVDRRFESGERLMTVIQQIVSGANRAVNAANPIVDAILPDGSRVNVVLEGVSCDGSAVTIRKFSEKGVTMKHLIEWGSIDPAPAALLEKLVAAGYNIFVSGGTGAGKTTFLNALAGFIPEDERVITIEDSAELRLRSVHDLVRLEARNANVEGKNQITIRDLIRTSLRMRPDRIIVGEVRDAAALDMLTAMNTGHDGSLSTGHANSVKDMLLRLETMVLMAESGLPLRAIRQQIASALDLIVHLGRLRDRSRRVLEISEIDGMEGEEIGVRTLYRFEETGEENGRVLGEMRKFRDLRNVEKLGRAGLLRVVREEGLFNEKLQPGSIGEQVV